MTTIFTAYPYAPGRAYGADQLRKPVSGAFSTILDLFTSPRGGRLRLDLPPRVTPFKAKQYR